MHDAAVVVSNAERVGRAALRLLEVALATFFFQKIQSIIRGSKFFILLGIVKNLTLLDNQNLCFFFFSRLHLRSVRIPRFSPKKYFIRVIEFDEFFLESR